MERIDVVLLFKVLYKFASRSSIDILTSMARSYHARCWPWEQFGGFRVMLKVTLTCGQEGQANPVIIMGQPVLPAEPQPPRITLPTIFGVSLNQWISMWNYLHLQGSVHVYINTFMYINSRGCHKMTSTSNSDISCVRAAFHLKWQNGRICGSRYWEMYLKKWGLSKLTW